MGCSDPTSVHSGRQLLPSIYADARYIDAVIVLKARQTLWQTLKTEVSTLAIIVATSILLIFGVAGAGLYTHPTDKWSVFSYVLSPLIPIVLFYTLRPLTEPSLSRRQLVGHSSTL